MKNFLRLLAISAFAMMLQSCATLAAGGITSQGQPTKKVEGTLTSTTANSRVNVDHSAWDKLLKKHVDVKGMVDYKGFAKDQELLNAYLDKLASLDPSNDWSVQELLAYYINIYNAYTVDQILKNPTVSSIKEIDGVWIKGIVTVQNRKLSLGGIENGILRKMNEPRIHFAINCASISCPALLREAYTAGKINEQLERATDGFINSDKNTIKANKAELSSIFKFYTKDFYVDPSKSLIPYINKYAKTPVNSNAPITFKAYDWGLNKQQ